MLRHAAQHVRQSKTLPTSARTLLHSPCRHLRRSHAHTQTPLPLDNETVYWPLYLGGALMATSMLSALIFRREGTLRRLTNHVSSAHASSIAADNISMRNLVGVVLAFGVTQLPVEETRMKLLKVGALGAWSSVLGLFDPDQQQIALGALVTLLEGDECLRIFRSESGWYEEVVHALPPLLHESEGFLQDPEILLEVLRLACTLVTHPIFLHSDDDDWIWERLIEEAAVNLYYEPAAVLPWACLAASCAERPELSAAMLRNDDVKRILVSLADSSGSYDFMAEEEARNGEARAPTMDGDGILPPELPPPELQMHDELGKPTASVGGGFMRGLLTQVCFRRDFGYVSVPIADHTQRARHQHTTPRHTTPHRTTPHQPHTTSHHTTPCRARSHHAAPPFPRRSCMGRPREATSRSMHRWRSAGSRSSRVRRTLPIGVKRRKRRVLAAAIPAPAAPIPTIRPCPCPLTHASLVPRRCIQPCFTIFHLPLSDAADVCAS